MVARDPAELTVGGRPRTASGSSGGGSGDTSGEEAPEPGPSRATFPEDDPPDRAAPSPGIGPDQPVSRAEAARDWAALLEEVPADARLVVAVSQDLPASSPLLKAALKLEPAVAVVRCLEATPKSAEVWVRKIASDLGGEIDPEASQALVLRSGSNLAILERELEKLVAYAGSPEAGRGGEAGAEPGPGRTARPRITRRDVLEAATPCAEASVFEMVDHLGNRRPSQAVMTLRRLIEQGEAPLGLMGMVTRQVRLIFIAREMMVEGASVRDVEERLKLPTWVVRSYLAQSRNFTREQLSRMMRTLGRLDLDVKTGRQEPGAGLELFILQQCS